MLEVSINGIDMSGKSTAMNSIKRELMNRMFNIQISPHLMIFANMSLQERLNLYENWPPKDFANQVVAEIIERAKYNNLLNSKIIMNDRGILTQVGFCIGKYITDDNISLEKAFLEIDKKYIINKLPFEKVSIILDIPLDVALSRAEGKEENWYFHYQKLLYNTRESINYLSDINICPTYILRLDGQKDKQYIVDQSVEFILKFLKNDSFKK